MKKLIGILILSFVFVSCENKPPSQYDEINAELEQTQGLGTQIVKVRGCEYIKSHVYLGRVFTHCGDCNNPIHNK